MRRRAKTDANHAEIINAFRKAGCSVVSLHQIGSGCPDLLVARDAYVLVEVKDGTKPPSHRVLTDEQKKFHAEWRGRIEVITSVQEAVKLANELRVT